MAASLEASPAEEITIEDAFAVNLANVVERGQGNCFISCV
jgi:hypothetical protein